IPNSYVGFASLQRGDHDATTYNNNLWRHETPTTSLPTTSANQPTQVFTLLLRHTLGYLNLFGPPLVVDSNNNTNAYASGNAAGTQYVGSPSNVPFPWLTWNNRPFVSPHEVMLVPRSRSSRLLYDYAASSATSYASNAPTRGHLLNFFGTDRPGVG